jgi:hypothetical protein
LNCTTQYYRKWRDDSTWEHIFHETEGRFPRLHTVLVDQGYKSWLVEFARQWFGIIVDIVQRHPTHREFVVQPQRWKIERTFGWLDWSRVSVRSMSEPLNRVKAIFISLRFV